MSRRDLALTFRAEIGKKLQEAEQADQDFKASLLSKLESTRRAGLALDAAQHDLTQQEFRALVGELGLSRSAVSSYLSFASRHSEPITDLKLAMRLAAQAALASGLLPAPEGHGPQVLHKPNFFSRLTVVTQDIASEFVKYCNRRPLDTWPVELREQFVETLRPILSMCKKVQLSLAKDKHDV